MNLPARSYGALNSSIEQLRTGREIIRVEANALLKMSETLDGAFCDAVELIEKCRGSVIVTGMGKAGLIGRKLAATLSSTGTRSFLLHPAEAVHGDLGCIHEEDVVLALSHSGETEEVCRLLPFLQKMNVPLVAITSGDQSTLGQQADVVISIGRQREADPHGLAPTVSTSVMLAVGDALAIVLSQRRAFSPRQFAQFHPGGSLGQQLRTVRESMRNLDEVRIAPETDTIRQVFSDVRGRGRRTGAVMLIDEAGRLSGLFTDSDLARLISQHETPPLDDSISTVMTRQPITVHPEALLQDVVEILTVKKVSELPVIDADHKPIGLIDITDVIGLMPQDKDD
ncbi:MAG: KpsF/GutQ family sugar-phosphate isomerase [Planctomycetaceae bacterium]|nr:KpsF/GutQ family sugar-phosphate isomerase [Planctomycetaceae bacterium]